MSSVKGPTQWSPQRGDHLRIRERLDELEHPPEVVLARSRQRRLSQTAASPRAGRWCHPCRGASEPGPAFLGSQTGAVACHQENRKDSMHRSLTLTLGLGVALAPGAARGAPAEPDVAVYALVVGSNAPGAGQTALHYAED